MAYVVDGRYLRNRVTGAVFPYRERIATLADLEEVVGVADGDTVVLEKLETRQPPSPKLAPTATPEKKDEAVDTTAKPATSKPTLAPVADK